MNELPKIHPRADADVCTVLRNLPQFLFAPNIIGALCVDAGLQLDGDECLKFSQKIAANYASTVDRMCGGRGGMRFLTRFWLNMGPANAQSSWRCWTRFLRCCAW